MDVSWKIIPYQELTLFLQSKLLENHTPDSGHIAI